MQLLADTITTCISNGVTLLLDANSHIRYGDEMTLVNGYFSAPVDDGKPILAVGCGKPLEQWLPLFIHESCHMDQYLENCKAWVDITMPDGREATDTLFSWIEYKEELTEAVLNDVTERALRVELDCEMRTVQKIIKYNLEELIPVNEYIRRANSYILFYLYMMDSRKMYSPNREPYNLKEVWMHAPDTFDSDYTQIPDALHEAFVKLTVYG